MAPFTHFGYQHSSKYTYSPSCLEQPDTILGEFGLILLTLLQQGITKLVYAKSC